MTQLPAIEDNFEDVLGKAMRGCGLNAAAVAVPAGLKTDAVEALLAGQCEVWALRRVAAVLQLNAASLLELATVPRHPQMVLPVGVRQHTTAFPVPGYPGMTVNSYSLLPPGPADAGAVMDAGAGLVSIRQSFDRARAVNWQLFLTHTHADHVAHFDALARAAVRAYCPQGEPYHDALPAREGDRFQLGPWQLTAIETPGHSPAALSYLLQGAGAPVIFVGDALFCYSIGKVAAANYAAALSCIRHKILSLPPETIICPGHGPITSVAHEREHNPFFAGT